jgi:hypothetical protein
MAARTAELQEPITDDNYVDPEGIKAVENYANQPAPDDTKNEVERNASLEETSNVIEVGTMFPRPQFFEEAIPNMRRRRRGAVAINSGHLIFRHPDHRIYPG